MNINRANGQYGVLSPWAEVDSIPLRGITPRVKDLGGKKIGLFVNEFLSSRLILTVIGEKLKERFPTCVTIWYINPQPPGKGVSDLEGEDKAKFEEWVKGVDAVVGAVGD